MTRLNLIRLALSVALLLTLADIGWAVFGRNELTLSQSELQGKIDSVMPYRTSYGVAISKVTLDLTDDKIGMSIEASARKLNTVCVVGGQVRGSLRYDDREGVFYFQPDVVRVTRMEIGGQPASDRAADFLDEWVDSKKLTAHKAEIAAGTEKAMEALLQKSTEVFFSRVPVFKLPPTLKGEAVHVFLQRIEVRDGVIIVHLCFWNLAKMILACAVILLLVMLAAQVKSWIT